MTVIGNPMHKGSRHRTILFLQPPGTGTVLKVLKNPSECPFGQGPGCHRTLIIIRRWSILHRWHELQIFYSKIGLTVRITRFGTSKGLLPLITLKLCFTHSGTAPWFQEDLNFWSAEQLELVFKIQTCFQVTWHEPASNSRSSHCDTATLHSFPLASITKRLEVSIIEYYKFVLLLFSGLSIAHKKKTQRWLCMILTILNK